MKKILYLAMALLTCTVTFTSCEDEDDFGNSNYEIVSNPAAAVAGNYSGTWTRSETGVEGSITFNGTMALSEADEAIYANVTFGTGAEDNYVNAVTVKSNIVQQGDNGFLITNYSSANGQSASFTVRVLSDGSMQVNFMKTVREGRKSHEYSYEFKGNK